MPKTPNPRRTPNAPPVVRALDEDLDAAEIFQALEGLPGRVWLDSSSASSRLAEDLGVHKLSRYSFLTADPLLTLRRYPDQPCPFDDLDHLVSSLPSNFDDALPPFQGGVVGVVGYEAGRWLEPLELAQCHLGQVNDLPTPALSFGVYDWTIAIDHLTRQSYLICQGFTADDLSQVDTDSGRSNAASRVKQAQHRAESILALIAERRGGGVRRIDRRPPERGVSNWRSSDPPASMEHHVSSNFTSTQFQNAVAEIVDRIRGGDSFQVNLAQRLCVTAANDLTRQYLQLRAANPAPFAGFYDDDDFCVLSSSPEGFLEVRNRHITTRPIKGTVARTGDPEKDEAFAEQLLASSKDRAENIMIVDLMRNDLSRVCTDQSVRATQVCRIERYEFVQHLVSVVEGDLKPGRTTVEALKACFPGGSVTGAPKIEAMKTIAELEPHPRGPYCGSLGYFSCGGNADFNILIRTMTQAHGKLQIPVGGGITARSTPEAEEAETWVKAEGMLQAVAGNVPHTNSVADNAADRATDHTAHPTA